MNGYLECENTFNNNVLLRFNQREASKIENIEKEAGIDQFKNNKFKPYFDITFYLQYRSIINLNQE